MAKEKEEKDLDLNQPITLTAADLLKLFSEMQKQQIDAADRQATAIAQLSPSYKSPEQKEFEQKARQQQRDQQVQTLKIKRHQQRMCQHEIGQTGTKRTGEGAFNLLKLPTGELIGVCTYCQKVISSLNPDHIKYFRSKVGGTMAESGQLTEFITDPIKAQLARLSPDEREKVMKLRSQYIQQQKSVALEDEDDI